MADLRSQGGGEGSPGVGAGAPLGLAAVEVAVRLGVPAGRIGEWVADAAAFDASGADALWLEAGVKPELDVLVLAGALAVVTFRARLVVALPADLTGAAAPGGLARALGTVGRLCNGRLVVVSAAGEGVRLAELLPGARVLARVTALAPPGNEATAAPSDGADVEAFVPLYPAASGTADGRALTTEPGGAVQRWLAVPAPDGRAAWLQARADAAARGARGVLVPADPRLLDLLRNPDDPGERTDLLLAQG